MKLKRVTALFMGILMTASLLAGCGGSSGAAATDASAGTAEEASDTAESTDADSGKADSGEIIEFSAFFATPATTEINDDNEVQQMIAEKTGIRVKETWLTGQTAEEAIGTIIAGGDYPDFINGVDAMKPLYDAGALVAWDDYIDKYPNIKEFFSEEEWDKFRQDDGHIYWMNPFTNIYGEDKTTIHNDEAFWVQARVLEWAGYPEIHTMDAYFDLLRDYNEANPTTEDGTENIPYTILCEDWRYFCLENAPQFLDGYPNDGSVIVNTDTLKIEDYNTTDTAVEYFKKLNEEYKNGLIDPEFATQTYDEYIAKLSTGRVLGMIDQWWDFAYTVNDVFKSQGTEAYGYNYIPLGITIEEGMPNQWHTTGGTLNVSNGLGISVDCQNVDAAFQFIDDLLGQELHDLRFWGEEGVDYAVDENGLYYRTEEQRTRWANADYKASHECLYSYFPQWYGTSRDGINAMNPTEQSSEFMDGLAEPVRKCFEAYGVTTYPGMIGSTDNFGEWFPMYSHSNTMTTETPGGVAWTKMGETKHEWLPKVVMSGDFTSAWSEYMDAYSACNPQDFLDEMQTELDRRIGK